MNTRLPLISSLLAVLLVASLQCQAETHREGQWLHYLQQGHSEGMDMPNTHGSEDDRLSFSQGDLKRLIGAQQAEQKRSRLQFTKLNYQADVSEKSVELRLFYQF